MTDETTRPKDSDASAHDVETEAGSEEAKPSSDKAEGSDVLGFLNRTLKREFASEEEAVKSLTELNGRVGDRSLADLRKKAETADNFDALVEGYAEEQEMSVEDAREELLSLAQGAKKKTSSSRSDADSGESKRLAEVEIRLDLADLLVTFPEAKLVLEDLKDLAKARGVSLQEAYRSSKGLQAAARSMASSSDKDNKGTVTHPSGRIGATPSSRKVQEAVDSYKKERSNDTADKMVKAALGL